MNLELANFYYEFSVKSAITNINISIKSSKPPVIKDRDLAINPAIIYAIINIELIKIIHKIRFFVLFLFNNFTFSCFLSNFYLK